MGSTCRTPRHGALLIDLHFHSNASDGLTSPGDAVIRAAQRGATWVALTDHDTFEGLEEAGENAASLGLEWLSGAEFSVWAAGEPVHLLAYGFDTEHKALASYVSGFRLDRARRADEILDRLTRQGIRIDREELAAHVGAGVFTRPHLAEALVREGVVADRDEAFDRFLGDGRSCHVSMPMRDAAETIELVHAAGGITSLAHPGDWTAHRTLVALARAGMDALEAWHPSHDSRLTSYYLDLADRWSLAVTGGSDNHGRLVMECSRPVDLPEPHAEVLRERLRLARQRSVR